MKKLEVLKDKQLHNLALLVVPLILKMVINIEIKALDVIILTTYIAGRYRRGRATMDMQWSITWTGISYNCSVQWRKTGTAKEIADLRPTTTGNGKEIEGKTYRLIYSSSERI